MIDQTTKTISFPVNLLIPSINTSDQLKATCKYHSQDLNAKFIENKAAWLWAMTGVESSYGEENMFRVEPAYSPGGLYFQRSKLLQSLYYDRKFGGLVCGSYSAWQILAITAYEKGYAGHPAELYNALVAAPYVIQQLNFLISKGADTMEKLAVGWNAGAGAINYPKQWPQKYVDKMMASYDRAIKLAW